jgi:hypothetical protein
MFSVPFSSSQLPQSMSDVYLGGGENIFDGLRYFRPNTITLN